jgi:hypothetical protein
MDTVWQNYFDRMAQRQDQLHAKCQPKKIAMPPYAKYKIIHPGITEPPPGFFKEFQTGDLILWGSHRIQWSIEEEAGEEEAKSTS